MTFTFIENKNHIEINPFSYCIGGNQENGSSVEGVDRCWLATLFSKKVDFAHYSIDRTGEYVEGVDNKVVKI